MLNSKTLYKSENSIGNRFRRKRIKPLLDILYSISAAKGSVNLLDVGGKIGYWQIIPRETFEELKLHITILNIPGENHDNDTKDFTHVIGDACNMPEYPDNSFDIVHSNSVIEHVGNWTKIKDFANEIKRVAPKLFIQTPNFWFPIEPHYMTPFFHWIPRYSRAFLIQKRTLGNRGKANDLDDAMQKLQDQPQMLNYKCFSYLFSDCEIIRESFFLLTKSFVAIRK